MIGSFHNLKTPEDHAKQKIAFFVALSISGLIFVVWGYFFVKNLNQNNSEDQTIASGQQKEGAFTQLKGMFSDMIAQVMIQKDNISSLVTNIKNSSTPPPPPPPPPPPQTPAPIEQKTEQATSTIQTQASTTQETEYQYN